MPRGNIIDAVQTDSETVNIVHNTDVSGGGFTLPKPVSLDSLKMVSCNLSAKLANWESELGSDLDKDYLLDGIQNRFDIEGKSLDFSANERNYRSATETCFSKVEAQIREEVSAKNYVIIGHKPKVVSSLGAILKPNGSVRLIHDLSCPNEGVNQFVLDSSCHYTSVDFATQQMHEDA